jgi:succinate dehydrogenase / fumarate reductase cytochrome b subunit
MTTTKALGGKLSPAATALPPLAETGVMKKVVMAISGAVLFGYVVGHLLGNLQIYQGRDKINAYSEFLHHTPSLLWGTRLVLIVAFSAHIVSAVQLQMMKRAARPVAYRRWRAVQASLASRTMIWGGLTLLAFVLYHLAHLTFGAVHPDYVEGDVYHNLISGFQQVPAAVAYIVAMCALGMHLYHGLWSATQSVGLGGSRAVTGIKRAAFVVAALIALGNISIPVAVLAGLLQ